MSMGQVNGFLGGNLSPARIAFDQKLTGVCQLRALPFKAAVLILLYSLS